MAEEEEKDGKRYKIEKIPLKIFTDDLDFEQERTLLTINEAMERGSRYAKAMADGNKEVIHEFAPLYRLVHGISEASIIPIMKLIEEESVNPAQAVMAVMGGVGAMFFFGGIEYAKDLGLDGVGINIDETEKANDEDPEKNYYPENKPNISDMPEHLGLDAMLRRFQEENLDLGEDDE